MCIRDRYNAGIYLFNQTSYSYDASTKTLSLSCSDLMSELTGARNGTIPAMMMQISEGTNIREVMIKALTQDYNAEGEENTLLNRPYIIDDIGGEVNAVSYTHLLTGSPKRRTRFYRTAASEPASWS